MDEKDCLGNQVVLGDRVCFYWQTKFFGKMVVGIVTEVKQLEYLCVYNIQTNHGNFIKHINEIIKVG